MEHETWDASGSVQTGEPIAQKAADTVVEWARDDLADCGEWDEDETGRVTVEIGRPVADMREITDSDEDAWARQRSYDLIVVGVRFEQTAAAVPVATMRRAIALAEQHDPELAAELRASLVAEE